MFFRLLWCLMLIVFVVRTDAAPKSSARTALVIGNAKYEAAVGPLRNTDNDAKAVAKTLRDLGFAVIEKHNVTRDQLLRAVLEFRTTLTNAEVGLFYYAGHGIAVAGSNYLLPIKSGYTPEGADDVTLRMLAETKLFNVEQAVADMKASGARCNLVILDACRTRWRWCQRPLHRRTAQTYAHARLDHRAGLQTHSCRSAGAFRGRSNPRRILTPRRR
jgi:hypothetical protein